MTFSSLIEMAESSPNGYKNTEGKGEIACDDKQFPTLFGKGLNVFHSYISLVSQNVSLCGNGLSAISLLELPSW